jgi:hypothetical protein
MSSAFGRGFDLLALAIVSVLSVSMWGCSSPSSNPGQSGHLGADSSVSSGDDAAPHVDAGSPGDSPSADAPPNDALSGDAVSGDAGPFCTKPLDPDASFMALADIPLAGWCEAAQGRISEWTCQGVTAVVIGIGADCDRQYLFDVTSKRLMAVVEGCNGAVGCVAGNQDLIPPRECWSGNVSLSVIELCAEAGLTGAGPDGAGSNCASNAQCPAGFVCGFFTNSPCASFGQCVYGDFNNDPTCSPTTLCACDNTLTQACVGSTGGYALKPVPTRGQSTTCAHDG